MTRFLLAASVAAFTLAAGAASAATITFSSLSAVWQNPVGGANIDLSPAGLAPTIRWGGTTPPKSGYNFTLPGATLSTGVGVDFVLGTFEHENFPIPNGTAITGVELKITADIAIDATPVGSRTFLFDFKHLETPNAANPCADGGANGVGVNANGCADRVTFAQNVFSETFTIGMTEYTITIAGFVETLGDPLLSEFWTAENKVNTALVIGRVTEKEIGIAEPASLALLGAGLLGLGFAARRRV